MAVTVMQHESAIFDAFPVVPQSSAVSELHQQDGAAALEFLAARPVHTVFMASLIHDNGIASPKNRGSFYACRDRQGELEGLALVGHATVVEARTEGAVAAFARLTRNCLNTRLIRGERKTVNQFWSHYANSGEEPRLVRRELLFEQREILPDVEPVEELRLATIEDLDQVLKVNAAMAFQEAGISPLNQDPGGFRSRTARRIEQGRVWVWMSDDRLIFKADVVAQTPQAAYLEGVHVHPEERLKGYGMRGITQLGSILLKDTESICLTASQSNRRAAAFYVKAGYQFNSHYETIYLR